MSVPNIATPQSKGGRPKKRSNANNFKPKKLDFTPDNRFPKQS